MTQLDPGGLKKKITGKKESIKAINISTSKIG